MILLICFPVLSGSIYIYICCRAYTQLAARRQVPVVYDGVPGFRIFVEIDVVLWTGMDTDR